MDSTAKYDNPSPRLKANPISKLIFWWLVPLFRYGKHHDLEIKDLHNALPRDLSHILGNRLERNWKREETAAIKTGRRPKLLTAIRKTFFWSYMYYGGWVFFHYMVIRILQPVVMGLLIWHFDPRSNTSSKEAYMYASGVVILTVFIAFINHHSNLGQLEIGMRVRIACSSLLYRKILRLSKSTANDTTGGHIVNLLSNDVARFEQVFLYLHYIWIMPVQAALITYMMWQIVEVAALASVFITVIQTIPIQGYIGKLTTGLRKKIAVRTDERVRLMTEIISGIKVIKMYTWEKPFEKIVSLARKYEVDVITLTSYLRGFTKAAYTFTDKTALYFTVMLYVLRGNDISAAKVFTLAHYIYIMQFTIAVLYPVAMSTGAEALVSITRLEEFLLLDEKKPRDHLVRVNAAITDGLSAHENNSNTAVSIKKVSASWINDSIANTLHDINLNVQAGKLCALVGPVGGGKSSLLQLILGELEASHGRVSVEGSVAYASQEPWLFAGTVRNNILFGLPYDETRYRRVTKVCALHQDFLQLPQGDKTRVGERGNALSGGQRARVNLARAVYRKADIYLLDDPLSAVDTHVGRQLFDECITGFLSKKTVILVTHQAQYLNACDTIVLLSNGVVLKQGTYKEFQGSDLDVAKTITLEEDTNDKGLQQEEIPASVDEFDTQSLSKVSRISEDESPETEELVAKGAMQKSIYWKYFSSGNTVLTIIVFCIIIILAQFGLSGTDYWIGHWTNQQEIQLRQRLNALQNSSDSSGLDNNTMGLNSLNFTGTSVENLFMDSTFTSLLVNDSWAPLIDPMNVTNLTKTADADDVAEDIMKSSETPILDRDTALWIYGGFLLVGIVMVCARNMVFCKICMNSSRELHNKMFSCLLQAPMRFFDKNPSGRILNRFSKDVGAVDELLPWTMLDSVHVFSKMTGIFVQVIIINWWTIFPMTILGFLYWKIRTFYLSTAQDVKRLESIAKSPVFSHVNSSLSGLDTIRSAGREHLVQNEFDVHQDLHTGAFSLSIATSTAFGLWLDFVTMLFVVFITYSCIFLNHGATLSGNVGLAITQVLMLCGMMQYGMRQTAETVAQMTGVERILQFTELEKEGPFESEPGSKPPAKWPAKGKIKFDQVYLRYDEENDPVLKDFNITVEPGMKVGIVGRTGAGKSSLISALFNLAKLEGNIFIDGMNIKKIGLTDFRCKISIIPQEPVLFSSTLRDNLDPFNKYEDALLWTALEQVQLKIGITSLDHMVTQGGTNFSAGQRQLLCLARAIVASNKILILDEATANVDPATDKLIQTTIRQKFKDCTVLTIAHRLNTIMDSDKVLVVDHGRAVEMEHPHLLLQKNDGYFTKMVQETGPGMSDKLASMAKEAYGRVVDVHVSDREIVDKHST